MGDLKLIRYLGDDLRFERAYIVAEDGLAAPRAVVGGVECNIETKPSLLEAGLCWCEPVDPEAALNWPMACLVEVSNADGEKYEQRFDNVSPDPGLVAAAIQFSKLSLAGEARPGGAL